MGGDAEAFKELNDAYENLLTHDFSTPIINQDIKETEIDLRKKKYTTAVHIDFDNPDTWHDYDPYSFNNLIRQSYDYDMGILAKRFLKEFHNNATLTQEQLEQIEKRYSGCMNPYLVFNINFTAKDNEIYDAYDKFKEALGYCPFAVEFFKNSTADNARKVIRYYCAGIHRDEDLYYQNRLEAGREAVKTLLDPEYRGILDQHIAFDTYLQSLSTIDPTFELAKKYIVWYWSDYEFVERESKNIDQKNPTYIRTLFENIFKHKVKYIIENDRVTFNRSETEQNIFGSIEHFDAFLQKNKSSNKAYYHGMPHKPHQKSTSRTFGWEFTICGPSSEGYANYKNQCIQYFATHETELNTLIDNITKNTPSIKSRFFRNLKNTFKNMF